VGETFGLGNLGGAQNWGQILPLLEDQEVIITPTKATKEEGG